MGYTSNGRVIAGLILLIIIVVVLFKVNLKQTINSNPFQSNMSYLEEKTEYAWNTYIVQPIEAICNLLSEQFKELQNQNSSASSTATTPPLPALNVGLNKDNQEVYEFGSPTSSQN